jgi:hypothetical protein
VNYGNQSAVLPSSRTGHVAPFETLNVTTLLEHLRNIRSGVTNPDSLDRDFITSGLLMNLSAHFLHILHVLSYTFYIGLNEE